MRRKLWMSAICFILLVSGISAVPISARAAPTLPYLALSRPDRGRVFAVTWSPDGQYVAVGTETGLWLYTDTLADVQHVATNPIHALAWSPDGGTLAIGYFGAQNQTNKASQTLYNVPIMGGGLQLWSVHKQGARFTLAQQTILFSNESVFALRFSPDGSQLATLSQSSYFVSNFDDALTHNEYHVGYVTHMAQDRLRVYTVKDTQPSFTAITPQIEQFQEPTITQSANTLSWAHNGQYLAVGRDVTTTPDNPSQVSLWDVRTKKLLAFSGFSLMDDWWTAVGASAYNATDAHLAIGYVKTINSNTAGGLIVCHSAGTTLTQCAVIDGDPVEGKDVATVAWHPAKPWLAYATGTVIKLWDANTGHLLATLDAANEAVTMLEWSPDGSKLLSSGSDYTVRIWTHFTAYQTPDPPSMTRVPLPIVSDDLSTGSVSPDGHLIAMNDQQPQNIRIVQVANGLTQTTFPSLGEADGYLDAARWSPDSTLFAVLSHRLDDCSDPVQSMQIRSTLSGKLLTSSENTSGIAWRSDSNAIATYESDHDVLKITDIRTGNVIQTSAPVHALKGIPGWLVDNHHILSVGSWSADGRLIALNDIVVCGTWDRSAVLLWDTQTNTLVAHLDSTRFAYRGSGGEATVTAWSPDGSLLAVQGFDQNYLYRLTWQRDHLNVTLVWQHPANSPFCGAQNANNTLFSPDGHYFLCDNTIWDMTTLWPVAHFRSTMQFNVYRWVGDTLTGYDLYGDPANHIPGKAVTVRASDFLPAGTPAF